MKDYNAQQKEIARLQRIVDRFKNKPTKVSMAHSKEKAIEHMVKLEAPDRFDTRTFHANFQPDKETGNDVLLVTNLAIGYDHPLSTVSFDLKKGEKLGILGGNGLGKSTLLKTWWDSLPRWPESTILEQMCRLVILTSRWRCIRAGRRCWMISGMSSRI